MTLEDVLTASEAADIYGLSESTLRRACLGQKGYPPRFQEGEFRKSGRVWLITRQAMERVYGKSATTK